MVFNARELAGYAGRIWNLGWRVVTEAGRVLVLTGLLGLTGILTAIVGYFVDHAAGFLIILFAGLFCAIGVTALIILGYHRNHARKGASIAPVEDEEEWTITDLFFHVCPNLERDRDNPTLRRETGTAVLDALSSGQIIMRGRKIDRSNQRRLPLTWMDSTYWQNVLFTYWFLDPTESAADVRHRKTIVEYADLRVSKAAALKVWPPPIPLRRTAARAYERTRGTKVQRHGRVWTLSAPSRNRHPWEEASDSGQTLLEQSPNIHRDHVDSICPIAVDPPCATRCYPLDFICTP